MHYRQALALFQQSGDRTGQAHALGNLGNAYADQGRYPAAISLRAGPWGRGFATEGSRALIRKGFTEFGVQRVTAEAMAANVASRRVMEKAGLTLVRTFRQPWPGAIGGDELKLVEYALQKTDWERLESC